MPSSGLTEMPSVRKQAPSNTRSSLAPASSTLGSPLGSGNPSFSSSFSIFSIVSMFYSFLYFSFVADWIRTRQTSDQKIFPVVAQDLDRSEEHTSELQSQF